MSILIVRQRGNWLVAGFNAEYLTEPLIIDRAKKELIDAFERLPLRGRAVISFEGVLGASSHVAALLRAARALVVDDRFGRLVLCRVGDRVGELLRLTGLDASFETFPRLRDVLAEPSQMKQTLVVAGQKTGASDEMNWID